jgi:hypothetical protein
LKVNDNAVIRQALKFLAPSRTGRPPRHHDEPPLRSELFSADQMEQHGKSLAAAHRVTSGHGADQLLPRLAANEVLIDA